MHFFACIQDRRTDPTIRQVPSVDASQDWTLTAHSQDGGVTTLEFSRLLDTGDTAGDRVIGEVYKLNAPTHVVQLQHYVFMW